MRYGDMFFVAGEIFIEHNVTALDAMYMENHPGEGSLYSIFLCVMMIHVEIILRRYTVYL